ncbi:hypothetical protein Bpfe_026706 [Biomphalaria pfeifferi]|uniref:Uncharacterized protein n=1 Tax=Biomphalaria pfeifferi TaxID=112525 RepID=A0AAD8AY21_BIOPF|nr:hypothetical protein Bpfe_026706 [Biomphalaria pfeifferi]
MKPLSRIRHMTYLAGIIIEFTGVAISEEVLLEMNTMHSGLVKINTSVNDWDRFFECMRNLLTSRCTLNLNETGTSGNFREFQSNGIRCEKTITKWLETPTFECNFQETSENTTEKCYSIVCSRPQNNCTLKSGCNGVLKIQWKTVSHCSSGDANSNTTQGNTNVSYTAENICFDGDTHIYDDCSLTEDFPSWEICASSTAQTEHAKLKMSTSDNANKDINEPDTAEYRRLRDHLRIAAVDYNCHFPDRSLISPRSSDISKQINFDNSLAKDFQTLGKDTLTISPYSLVELVEPSNEPNFRFNQTDLAQNILLQQIEMITIF